MKTRSRLSLLLILVLLTASPAQPLRAEPARAYGKYSGMFFGTFDTAISLIGFAESKEIFDREYQRAETMFTELHRQFNQYLPYEGLNNLYFVNRNAAAGPVKVPGELFGLLEYCKRMQPQTRGTVNVALGAVLALWHDARESAEADPAHPVLPDIESLRAAAGHTDMDDVVLDAAGQTVFFRDPLLKLDLGAVAKGYAAEKVAQALLAGQMPHFILNAGGNVRAGLSPMDGREEWSVAIQDPDGENLLSPDTGVIDILYLHDTSVVTSGDYQRFFIAGGRRYHHLISPDTLFPAEHMRSVSIVTRDSAYADLLSTAVFLMPFEQGYDFVRSLEGVEAYWVLNDRSVRMTPGLEGAAHSLGAGPH